MLPYGLPQFIFLVNPEQFSDILPRHGGVNHFTIPARVPPTMRFATEGQTNFPFQLIGSDFTIGQTILADTSAQFIRHIGARQFGMLLE